MRLVAVGWLLLTAGTGVFLLPWLGLWGAHVRALAGECKALQETDVPAKPLAARP
ncbi:MAG: hypothetical protein ACKVYV_18370 [Limisphaerales bacterium]